MRQNLYNTGDPEVLLRLKRQEAEALRDVLRSINNAHLKPEQIFKVARNTLLAQCDVRKMKFIYKTDEGFITGIRVGFPKLQMEALQELPQKLEIIKISKEKQPHLFDLKVEYVVPINYKNQIGAWFLIAEFAESEAEIENDLIFIETIGNVISAAIENRHLIEEMVQQESLRRELEVAEKIQQALLPGDFSMITGAEVYAENCSHHKIGGDFFDVIPRGDRGFFACIADVAGKGIGAALLMANLSAHLRALILSESTLESVVRKLHTILMEITKGEQFVTFFIAHVRTKDKQIDYINAGHNAPLLLNNGDIVELKAGTIPLGIIDLPEIEEETVKYNPGDLMFLYTDGLVEQHNEDDEMLDDVNVIRHLQSLKDASAEELVKSMDKLRIEFSGGTEQDDDVTMMGIRFTE